MTSVTSKVHRDFPLTFNVAEDDSKEEESGSTSETTGIKERRRDGG
jgi:hypothetical protein